MSALGVMAFRAVQSEHIPLALLFVLASLCVECGFMAVVAKLHTPRWWFSVIIVGAVHVVALGVSLIARHIVESSERSAKRREAEEEEQMRATRLALAPQVAAAFAGAIPRGKAIEAGKVILRTMR